MTVMLKILVVYKPSSQFLFTSFIDVYINDDDHNMENIDANCIYNYIRNHWIYSHDDTTYQLIADNEIKTAEKTYFICTIDRKR